MASDFPKFTPYFEQNVVLVDADDVPEQLRSSLKLLEYEDEKEPHQVIMAHCMPIRIYRKRIAEPLKCLQFHLVHNCPRHRVVFTGGAKSEPYQYFDGIPTHREAWNDAWLTSQTVLPAQRTLYRSPHIIASNQISMTNPHFVECAHSMPFPRFNSAGDPLLVPIILPKGIRGFMRVRSHQFREEPLFNAELVNAGLVPVNAAPIPNRRDSLSADEREFEELNATPFILPSLKLTAQMIRDVYAERESHLLAVSSLDTMAAGNNVFHRAIKDCVYEMAIPANDRIGEMINLHNQIAKLYQSKIDAPPLSRL